MRRTINRYAVCVPNPDEELAVGEAMRIRHSAFREVGPRFGCSDSTTAHHPKSNNLPASLSARSMISKPALHPAADRFHSPLFSRYAASLTVTICSASIVLISLQTCISTRKHSILSVETCAIDSVPHRISQGSYDCERLHKRSMTYSLRWPLKLPSGIGRLCVWWLRWWAGWKPLELP